MSLCGLSVMVDDWLMMSLERAWPVGASQFCACSNPVLTRCQTLGHVVSASWWLPDDAVHELQWGRCGPCIWHGELNDRCEQLLFELELQAVYGGWREAYLTMGGVHIYVCACYLAAYSAQECSSIAGGVAALEYKHNLLLLLSGGQQVSFAHMSPT